MSKGVYENGVKILEVVDQYLAGDITSDEASDKVELFEAQIDAAVSKDQNPGTATNTNNLSVQISVRSLTSELIRTRNPLRNLSSTMTNLQNARDSLAKDLGK